ncbi:MAG: sulfatase-like hydrolase/transferase [Nitrospiraceae bacterium]|nr:sulfatase-like hydrolase/transferase [Nitrospiraceae bacterium]
MNRRDFLRAAGAASAAAVLATHTGTHTARAAALPHIVYILADDMGYGDVAYLNKDAKIPTPYMDRLGAEGMVFTDAHSGSAVCTPTRYGVLTGRYCWRSTLKSGVLSGYSPGLMDKARMTVASYLRQHGYKTACVGKWHLGLDWATTDGEPARDGNVDYARPVANGPTGVGFDYFFGIPASLDMTPYVYVENDTAVAAATGRIEGRKGTAFYRGGPTAPGFKHVDVLPQLTRKAVDCIDRHAAEDPGKPLFLYFPLSAPHTPILPTKEFEGKSGIGPYGDFVCQVDWTVGQVMEALVRHGMAGNTLLIVTSDNGCSPMAQFDRLHRLGHYPSYHFRGYKADIYEGGHRIPFIARWPGRITAGTECGQTICLTDLLATAAEIVGEPLPDNAGEDSVSILPALLGKANAPLREATVHHSINGSFSIRQGHWKLELCPGSGGWSYPRPKEADKLDLPPVQLYDLSVDIGETTNVQDKHPEVVARLTALLEKYVRDGRSTPGVHQQNEGITSIWGPKRKPARRG